MFKHIIVPLDGSRRAERAILVAARIARPASASITLLRAVEVPIEYPTHFAQPIPIGDGTAEMKEAISYLEHVAQTSDLKGLNVQTEAVFGSPALKVIQAAGQAELIVMCSHGYTGMTRWMLGSVAEKVVRHAPVPVLILREHGPLPLPPITMTPTPLRVLITLDGSTLAEEVVAPVVQLLLSLDATAPKELHLLRVVDLPATVTGVGKSMAHVNAEMIATIEKEAMDYIVAFSHQLQNELPEHANFTISSAVAVESDVASAIVRSAEEGGTPGEAGYQGYTLIAMATHGRNGLPRWVIGSITERVLHGTTLPVFVVRPKKLAAIEEVDAGTGIWRQEAEETKIATWPALF